MAGRSGYRFDIYQLSREEPEDPFIYLAVPAGREITASDLRRDGSGTGILRLHPYIPDSENHGVCTICLAGTTSRSDFKVTLCNHIFHTRCILRALRYEARCPNCRGDLFIPL